MDVLVEFLSLSRNNPLVDAFVVLFHSSISSALHPGGHDSSRISQPAIKLLSLTSDFNPLFRANRVISDELSADELLAAVAWLLALLERDNKLSCCPDLLVNEFHNYTAIKQIIDYIVAYFSMLGNF